MYSILVSFVDCEGWVHWFLKCQCSLLPSHLTTFNLPWFMDLTFQVPMHYCSLQNQTLLLWPVTSTTWCYFCFGSFSLFFLQSFSPMFSSSLLGPSNLVSPSFSVLSFCLFIPFMVFSRQEYWSGLPFFSPVNHILWEFPSMTHASWVALHSMVHCFIELDNVVVHVITLFSFLWLWFSFCHPYPSER